MSDGLLLSILSPERRLVQNVRVQEVTLPGSEGQIQVLPGHAAMIGTLETGIFTYQSEGAPTVSGVISSGFFEVREGVINVMAETLELKGEIDLNRAQKAQKLAEDTLKEADLDEHRFKKYQLKLQRSIVRQNIGSADH
jgi:F-type H+-transporting ATPase subunit epsilon